MLHGGAVQSQWEPSAWHQNTQTLRKGHWSRWTESHGLPLQLLPWVCYEAALPRGWNQEGNILWPLITSPPLTVVWPTLPSWVNAVLWHSKGTLESIKLAPPNYTAMACHRCHLVWRIVSLFLEAQQEQDNVNPHHPLYRRPLTAQPHTGACWWLTGFSTWSHRHHSVCVCCVCLKPNKCHCKDMFLPTLASCAVE